ncbi:MAG: exo-alpha-sialidase [Planctomycetaceae bacterium]|nr:exo-alpha-sialidase [Planctomycetaceae bacterium]
MIPQSRRSFLQQTSLAVATYGLLPRGANCAETSFGENPPLLKPVFDKVVCPWTPEHPRHDHQLIFPLDKDRLLLVWSEYYSKKKNPQSKPGQSGVNDAVACQISSMVSKDRGRTWGDRKVIQPNRWKHNVKHPNLVRLSDKEILFSYVGWDSETDRNVYLRRSNDNGQTWSDEIQISEPGWYCNNADRALRLSTGRVLLPAHGPFDEKYIGGGPYRGGNLHSFVFYSDDGFRTWKRSEDSMTAPGRGCHEPTIVELKDGRLFCLLRNTNRKQYASYSEDGGIHWSKPKSTVLTSPESPALVKRIPTTGDLLVLWNNIASKSNWPRTPLSAAISKDEGQTWTHVKDIDNRSNYDAAYPSVTFRGDEALIAYYSRPTKWKRDTEITLRIYKIEQFYA